MKVLLKYLMMSIIAASFVACSSSRTAVPSKTKTIRYDQINGKGSTTNSGSKTSSKGEILKGKASYYADKFHGKKTASGEPYDKKAYTCAHKTLQFGTMLKVKNMSNGKSVKVRVNDRGPFVAGRIIDLSGAAAEAIDMKKAGVVDVEVEILK